MTREVDISGGRVENLRERFIEASRLADDLSPDFPDPAWEKLNAIYAECVLVGDDRMLFTKQSEGGDEDEYVLAIFALRDEFECKIGSSVRSLTGYSALHTSRGERWEKCLSP